MFTTSQTLIKHGSVFGEHSTYEYDLGGNKTVASLGSGRTITTVYDNLNRPLSITENGRTTSYGYDLAGNAVLLVSGNGQVTENTYDANNRLIDRVLFRNLSDRTESGVQAEFGWIYDEVGNVTAQHETWPGSVDRSAGIITTTMTYDNASRLETEVIVDPVDGTTATTYAYDAANNRSSKTVTGGEEPGFWTYTYNVANQLTGWEKKTSPEGNVLKSASLQYDPNGNRSRQVVDDTSTPTWARLVNQGTTYEAVASGAGGDELSVELRQPVVGGQPLAAAVNGGKHVVVTLAASGGQPDSLADQGITYTTSHARMEGSPVSVALHASDPNQVAGVTVNGNEIQVGLATSAGDAATAQNQGITYQAVTPGPEANGTTLTLLGADSTEETLGMAYGTGLTVQLASEGGSYATASLPGVNYHSPHFGTVGNGVTVTQTVAATPGASTEVSVDGNAVTVVLGTTLGDRAQGSLTGMDFTAVATGPEGNQISISLVDPGYASAGLSASVDGSNIVVSLGTDSGGVVTSTFGDVASAILGVAGSLVETQTTTFGWDETAYPTSVTLTGGGANFAIAEDPGAGAIRSAISTHPAASDLVQVTDGDETLIAAGTGVLADGEDATYLTTATELVALLQGETTVTSVMSVTGSGSQALQPGVVTLAGGGEDFGITSTADDVVALLQGHTAASQLVAVSGGGSTVVQALAATQLTGGQPPELSSTVDDLVTLLQGNAGVSALMTASGTGSQILAPAGPLFLSGGAAPTTHYTWDLQNRLTGVQMPDGKNYEYDYDYRGRRISIKEGGTATPLHTAVVFSEGLSVAEYERPTAQATLATPTVEYVRGTDMGGGIGGMLYSVRSADPSPVKYSLSNGRGDVVAQSDQSAALTWTASYEAFGRRTTETGDNQDKQRANTKDEDPTGLLNEGHRYRDLETGVFLSRDPAGAVDGPNVYTYVQQNPWTKYDPDGLFWHIAVGAGIGALWGVASQAVSDLVARKASPPSAYAAAAIGGAASGATLAMTGNPTLAGAVGGAAQSTSQQLIETQTVDCGQVAKAAVVGAVGGKAGAVAGKAIGCEASKVVKGVAGGLAGGFTGGATQMLDNYLNDEPLTKNLKEATLTGTITGTVGGAMAKSCFLAGTEVTMGDGQKMAIEEIRLGQRVWTPDGQAGMTCVNAETWKRYDLRLLDHESRGDAFDISVLVPPGWLEQRSRKDGHEVWLEFEELDAAGWAQVIREAPCPAIASGPGRVVTATITHASEDVRSMTLSSGEQLGVTGNHRIYSAARQDWIPVKGLKQGEQLSALAENSSVAGHSRQNGRYRVYNLEVEEEHCYYAGTSQILVHNTCKTDPTDSGNPGTSGNPAAKNVDLTDAKGRTHILDGDAIGTGGGHGAGRGKPGKSEFPSSWSDDRVIHEISDIATDPKVPFSKPDKRGYSTGTKTVDGIDVKVVVDQKKGRIVTGYPTNVPRNP